MSTIWGGLSVERFCILKLSGETDVRVTVGYSDTFADPRGCHSNRRPLYSVDRVDITLEREQWAERAALARAAHSARFSNFWCNIHPIHIALNPFILKQLHILLTKSLDDGLLVGVGCGLVGLRLVVWGLVGRGCLVLGACVVVDLLLDEG